MSLKSHWLENCLEYDSRRVICDRRGFIILATGVNYLSFKVSTVEKLCRNTELVVGDKNHIHIHYVLGLCYKNVNVCLKGRTSNFFQHLW